MPKISSRLARMDPMSEAWTILISFFDNAMLLECQSIMHTNRGEAESRMKGGEGC